MEIKGRTALITGGAHRVGKAIALAMAQAGANVVVNYHRSAEAAEATAAEARALGAGALAVQANIADAEQVAGLIAAGQDRFGGIDILINNASLFERTPVPTSDFSAWHRVIDILIHGSFYCANGVAPLMLERGAGVIINILDLSVWEAWPNLTAHCVGKTGLWALTRQLALELAPTIRVNGVAPGPVLPPPGYDQAKIDRTRQQTLLNRWGAPEDVSEAVLFLVAAEYITGEVIVVDGGQRLGHRRLE